jgi:glycosyltransferase involved in cell wall biosynthesis
MKTIIMLLSNPYRPDVRVEREASILTQAGYNVVILAWDRLQEFAPQQQIDKLSVWRIQSVPSTYGAGARQFTRLPLFWVRALQAANSLRFDAVHCHDLDTLPAGYWLKRRTGARLLFDAHEDYPALMSLYLPPILVRALRFLENLLVKKSDLTITASTVLADKYRKDGVHPVISIGNVQRLIDFTKITDAERSAARKDLGLSSHDFVVAYIGGFSRNRLILPLIEAAEQIPDARFLIWGDGHQRQQIEKAVREKTNVRYLGWLESSQVPLFTRMADVVYYAIKPDYPGAVFNAPNTLSNAMAAGTPVLCNDVGDLGHIVASTGCGVLLQEVTPQTIATALKGLRDPELREKLGKAGFQAAQQTYNWEAVSNRLLLAYQETLRAGT